MTNNTVTRTISFNVHANSTEVLPPGLYPISVTEVDAFNGNKAITSFTVSVLDPDAIKMTQEEIDEPAADDETEEVVEVAIVINSDGTVIYPWQ